MNTCNHTTRLGDLCVDCGMNVFDASLLYTPLHTNDQIRITKEEAIQQSQMYKTSLDSTRRLVLVLDLDQTLIHTTIAPPISAAGYHSFSIGLTNFVLRVRPGVRELLESLLPFYEMHVYTMGTRDYATNVCQILDPKGVYFGDRIITRTENHGKLYKSLDRISLCYDNIVIIDDRADVWNFSDNLILIKAYWYFDIGDINDPDKLRSSYGDVVDKDQNDKILIDPTERQSLPLDINNLCMSDINFFPVLKRKIEFVNVKRRKTKDGYIDMDYIYNDFICDYNINLMQKESKVAFNSTNFDDNEHKIIDKQCRYVGNHPSHKKINNKYVNTIHPEYNALNLKNNTVFPECCSYFPTGEKKVTEGECLKILDLERLKDLEEKNEKDNVDSTNKDKSLNTDFERDHSDNTENSKCGLHLKDLEKSQVNNSIVPYKKYSDKITNDLNNSIYFKGGIKPSQYLNYDKSSIIGHIESDTDIEIYKLKDYLLEIHRLYFAENKTVPFIIKEKQTKIFCNKKFFVMSGQYKALLEKLLIMHGGIVTNLKRARLILADDIDEITAMQIRKPIVGSDWVLQCIYQYEYVDYSSFVLFDYSEDDEFIKDLEETFGA